VRPSVYTAAQAACRVGVSRRTIRQWIADGRLVPLNPDRTLGYYLFDGPSLAAAEHSARWGRTRRRRLLP